MKVKYLLLLLFYVPFVQTFGENLPIAVFESTLKINALGTEEFYYAFSEGDQLIINFEEVKGKELKEFEVIEYPSSSKFMDYKTSRIKDKVITIQRTAIYKFRLVNSAVSGRICKLSLQRIPANDAARNFNCTVNWRTSRF